MNVGTVFKRVLRDSQYFNFLTSYPKFRLGALLACFLCTFFIVLSTFTQLKLSYIPLNKLMNFSFLSYNLENIIDIVNFYLYIPQVPAVLFAGALLGPRIGMLSVLIYIILGLLGFPVFASGGGFSYYNDSGFGYILGYILATYLVGHILSNKVNLFTLIKATLVGCLSIHVVGILYLLVLLSLQHNSIVIISEWIWIKSVVPFAYDFFMGFSVIALARPIRGLLWAAMD